MAAKLLPEHGSIHSLRNGQKPHSPPFQPKPSKDQMVAALHLLERQQIADRVAFQRLIHKLEVTNHTVSELSQRVARLAKTVKRARLLALCATGAMLGYCREGSRKGLFAGAMAGAAAAALWNHFNQAQQEIGPF